jgi:cob(I)alamin adenosyltransferase
MAERRVAKMKSKRMLDNLKLLGYLNRLSDVLYFIVRYKEKRAKVKPNHLTYNLSTLGGVPGTSSEKEV